MMPRLEAEQRLAAINDIAVGTGTLREQQQREVIRRLARAAKGGQRPRAAKASVATLAQMGIGVSTVPKKAESNG